MYCSGKGLQVAYTDIARSELDVRVTCCLLLAVCPNSSLPILPQGSSWPAGRCDGLVSNATNPTCVAVCTYGYFAGPMGPPRAACMSLGAWGSIKGFCVAGELFLAMTLAIDNTEHTFNLW